MMGFVSDLMADARMAMLTRLAGDINVLAHAPELTWTCCYQDFYHWGWAGRVDHWGWRFCNGGLPGQPFATQPCAHWHHGFEPPLLALASA